MSCNAGLTVDGPSVISLDLEDEAGLPVTDASVELVQVLDLVTGTGVAGFTPPLTLPHVPATPGHYEEDLVGAQIVEGRRYEIKVVATIPGGGTPAYYRIEYGRKRG